MKTVQKCTQSAKPGCPLSKKAHPLTLFLAERPVESVYIDILGALSKSKRGFVLMLVSLDPFTNLTEIIPLRRIPSYDVTIAFKEHFILKYGSQRRCFLTTGHILWHKFFKSHSRSSP